MKKHSGFNLIELMIAITIGMIILVTMLIIVSSTSRTFKGNDDNARIVDIGTLAIRTLANDISQAGYLGEQDSNKASLSVFNNAGAGKLCKDYSPVDYSNPIFQIKEDKIADCALSNSVIDRSPAISIKLATEKIDPTLNPPPALEDGSLYLEADAGGGILFKGSDYNEVASQGKRRDRGSTGLEAYIYHYQNYVYYINSVAGNLPAKENPDQPILVRRRIDENGAFIDEAIAEGIEALSIEWGVDENGQGVATKYYSDREAVPDWKKVVSANIYMLVRVFSPDYVDPPNTEYILGEKDPKKFTVLPAGAPWGRWSQLSPNYRRRVFTLSVQIRNRTNI